MTIYVLALALVTSTPIAQAQAQPETPSRLAELAAEARRLQTGGQRNEALALYRQILSQDPRHAEAHLGMGESLDLEGKFSEARQHLQKAIELSPEEDVNAALSAMGISYAFEGNAAEAAKYYQRAFDRQVKTGALDSAGGTANALGRVYLETGDIANAEKWYRTGYDSATKMATRTPAQEDLTEMRWRHAQARIAARRKQFDIARKHVDEVRAIVERGRLGPGQRVNYPHVAGYVAFYEGNADLAIAELLKADQADPFILALLAQAHEQKGDKAKAREIYTQIVAVPAHSLQTAFARPVAERRLAAGL
jgi:tetratricopeptide (TPR) repeat protein